MYLNRVNLKKTALFLLLSGFCTGIFAQTTIYSFSFASLSGWTTNDHTGGGNWARVTNGVFNSNTAYDGWMRFDSELPGNDGIAENADLTSPPINCAAQDKVFLSFDSRFLQFTHSKGMILVSNDGINFVKIDSLTQTSSNPQKVLLNITSVAANQATVYIRFKYIGDWDISWEIDDIRLYKPLDIDLAATSILTNRYVTYGHHAVKYEVANYGFQTISSFIARLDINGYNFYDTLSGLYILPGKVQEFTHTQDLYTNDPTIFSLTIELIEPNGASDNLIANNSIQKEISCVSAEVEKKVLVESFGASSCGFCPGNDLIIDSLYNEGKINSVNIHIADAYETGDGFSLYNNLNQLNIPADLVDRVYFTDEDFRSVPYTHLRAKVNQQLATNSPLSIHLQSAYNATTKQINVDCGIKFYTKVNESLNVSVYLIEDNLYQSQVNGFSGNPVYPTHPYFSASNPITSYQNNFILRSTSSLLYGNSTIIPSSINNLDSFTYSLNVDVPLGVNISNSRLVVFVNKADNSEDVLNSLSAAVGANASNHATSLEPSSIAEKDDLKLIVYPNPTQNDFYVDFGSEHGKKLQVCLMDISGRILQTQHVDNNEQTIQISLQNYVAGYYLLWVKDEIVNKNYYLKVLKVNK